MGLNNTRISYALIATLSITSMPVAVIEAQQASEGAARLMEEVTVTARRREETELQTPIALTTFSGAALQERGIENLVDLDSFTPGLSIGGAPSRGQTRASFSIRGIGTHQTGINTDPTVGIYVDDVYYPQMEGGLLDLLDVERIEVLRGPQGTLFGKNTMGGAIRYFTVQPGEEFGGRARITLGSYARQDVDAAVDIPLADNLGLRATAALKQRDGVVTRLSDGVKLGNEDVQATRLQLRWTPGEWDVRASLDNTVAKNNGPARDILFICPWVPGGTAWSFGADRSTTNCIFPYRFNLNTGEIFDDRFVTADPYTVSGGDPLSHTDTRRKGGGLSFRRDFGNVTFTATTGWQKGEQSSLLNWAQTSLPLLITRDEEHWQSWTQELQFSGVAANDRLNWSAGVFYFTNDASNDANLPGSFSQGLPSVPSRNTRESTSTAFYFQGTYDVTEKLGVTLGARYTEDEEYRTAGVTAPLDVEQGTWDTVDPKLSLEYQFTDALMGYVSASRGYRPGGFSTWQMNGIDELRLYDEEQLWNYEIGVKGRFIDGRLQLTAALFQGDYDDLQVTTVQIDTGNNNQQFRVTENAARAHVNGGEIEFQALLTDKFLLRGSYAALDTGYDEIDPISTLDPVASKFVRAPEDSYSIGLQYISGLATGGELSWNLDYGWKDDQETSNTGTQNITIEAYGLLNGRLQYTPPGANWRVALVGSNLLDEEYIISGADNAIKQGVIGIVHVDRGRPREYGIQISMDF